jgi:hypothetical protein
MNECKRVVPNPTGNYFEKPALLWSHCQGIQVTTFNMGWWEGGDILFTILQLFPFQFLQRINALEILHFFIGHQKRSYFRVRISEIQYVARGPYGVGYLSCTPDTLSSVRTHCKWCKLTTVIRKMFRTVTNTV